MIYNEPIHVVLPYLGDCTMHYNDLITSDPKATIALYSQQLYPDVPGFSYMRPGEVEDIAAEYGEEIADEYKPLSVETYVRYLREDLGQEVEEFADPERMSVEGLDGHRLFRWKDGNSDNHWAYVALWLGVRGQSEAEGK